MRNHFQYILKEVLRTHSMTIDIKVCLEHEALFTLYVEKIVACEIFLFIKTCTMPSCIRSSYDCILITPLDDDLSTTLFDRNG